MDAFIGSLFVIIPRAELLKVVDSGLKVLDAILTLSAHGSRVVIRSILCTLRRLPCLELIELRVNPCEDLLLVGVNRAGFEFRKAGRMVGVCFKARFQPGDSVLELIGCLESRLDLGKFAGKRFNFCL